MGNLITIQKIPKKVYSVEDIVAKFCCCFPQYKFNEARKLPFVRIKKMLDIWEKEYSRKMIDLIEVVSAPHTKKGIGINKAIQRYKKILDQ